MLDATRVCGAMINGHRSSPTMTMMRTTAAARPRPAVNLRTAKEIGLPTSLQILADEVIE